MEWRYLFPAAATAASVAPVAYGASRVARWGAGPRMLWIWLAATATLDIVSMILSLQHIRSFDLALFGLPLLAVLGFEAMGQLTESHALIRRYRLCALIGVIATVLAIVLVEKRGQFDHFVTPGWSALLTLGAAFLLIRRVQSGVPTLLRDTAIIAALAILLLSAPSAILFAVDGALRQEHPALVRVLYHCQSVLEVCGSLLTVWALRWAPIAPR